MANISNISLKGLKGGVTIKGLSIVYFSSFIVWKNDNDKSLDKTMNSLDLYLERVNNLIKIY